MQRRVSKSVVGHHFYEEEFSLERSSARRINRYGKIRQHRRFSFRFRRSGPTIRSSAITMTRTCKAFEARVTQQLPPVRRLHASRNGAPDDTGRRVEDYRVFVKRFATAGFPWRNAKCIPLLCKPRLPANSHRKRTHIASKRADRDRVPVMKTRSASAEGTQ